MSSRSCYNVLSYKSGFTQTPLMPRKQQIDETRRMMKQVLEPKVQDMKKLLQKLIELIPIRVASMEIISEAIEFLKKKHLDVSIAKVTGSSVSLVGNGLMAGGIISAPFTLGVSLILTAVGGGMSAMGGATSVGAGLAERAIYKKKMTEIQKAVDEDNKLTKEIQEMWEDITGTCVSVAEKHPTLSYSPQQVFSVLLVCCTRFIDKRLNELNCKPSREKVEPHLHHGIQSSSDGGSGEWSIQADGEGIDMAVLSALIIQTGSTVINHCSTLLKMGC